uniref:Chalcone isomerase domain-containing protein n=2 Tax=Lotharella globosa TaxID=91324 RepID=A0A7S3YLP8_9EUKA
MGSVEDGMRKPLLNDGDDDTKKKSTCYSIFCNGLGTTPFYYGYAYGALTLLVLYLAMKTLSPEEATTVAASADYGDGVVRGGYRWPTAPMVEPISKTSFPFESKGLSPEAGMLLGVAIRLKKVVGVNFKVYAVGLYVNPAGARSALKEHQGEALDSLRTNSKLFSKMTNSNNFRSLFLPIPPPSVIFHCFVFLHLLDCVCLRVPNNVTQQLLCRKTLELRFLRSVGKEKLVETFNEGLAVRMRKALGMQGVTIVEEFLNHFGDMSAGQTLIFHIEKGSLSIKVHNKEAVKFSSPELASSMLDLYFGEQPTVGEDVKKNLIERVPALWLK